jgi:CheY-like chemotaxis protein
MQPAETFFLPLYLPLFVVSTFKACIFFAVIAAMAFAVFGFYRSNVNSYVNKIKALGKQVSDMQQHLDYSSREETKARADAKRAAVARENLLTSLSHEIRTPMNGILGMAILLEETKLNHEQKDYIDTIISSGRILLNKVDEVMANDMLEQSKINRTIDPAQQKNTDLRNCVEEVIDMFAVKASASNVQMLYEIDQQVPTQILTDNKRLQQVLTNLVENVMECIPEQVVIGVHLIKHSNANTLPLLGISVAGKLLTNAIEAAVLLAESAILAEITHEEEQDKNYRAVAISKKLVEEMNGDLKEIPGIDGGYIFSIPLHTVAMVAGNSVGYNLKDFEGKSVLIVNNNAASATILNRQMRQWKLQPVIATSGNMALQLIGQQHFSLVITEMELPDMEGTELAESIKQSFPQVPLLLLNSINNSIDTKNTADITVLNKPLKQHVLFDNILSNLRPLKKAGQMKDMPINKLSADFAKQYPLRILLAEDNVVNQKWAIKILSKLGYSIDIADNGHIALDMVGKTNYDLILMDVQMPEMDGLEATKMIRVCLSKQPTIIAMTANVMHGDRVACMQAGMDDYISKPVQLGELVNMLEKWAMVISDKKLV